MTPTARMPIRSAVRREAFGRCSGLAFVGWTRLIRVLQNKARRGPCVCSRMWRGLCCRMEKRLNVRWSLKVPGTQRSENVRLVAEQFPLLAWNRPPKRKPQESDGCRMSAFTAVDLATTYFGVR